MVFRTWQHWLYVISDTCPSRTLPFPRHLLLWHLPFQHFPTFPHFQDPSSSPTGTSDTCPSRTLPHPPPALLVLALPTLVLPRNLPLSTSVTEGQMSRKRDCRKGKCRKGKCWKGKCRKGKYQKCWWGKRKCKCKEEIKMQINNWKILLLLCERPVM